MPAAIQIDVAGERVDLGYLNHFVLRLDDVPGGRMLHEEGVAHGLAPLRTERYHIAGLLARGLPPVGFDKLGLELGLRNDLLEDSAEASSSDVVSSLP